MEAKGVATMASGDVRFTFRSDETDVNVTIEGKRAWVESIVEELGLSEVGVMLPIGVQSPLQDSPSQRMIIPRMMMRFFHRATWGLNRSKPYSRCTSSDWSAQCRSRNREDWP